MTPTRHSGLGWFGAWTLATLLFVVALAARFALVGVLPAHGFPFLTFFPAVMLAAYVCGLGPGIAVSMASIVAARYFFIEPAHAFGGMSQGDTVALVFFPISAHFTATPAVPHSSTRLKSQQYRVQARG